MNQIKKIALLTSGGDAPGMNKVLYTICECAIKNQIEPYVVINGYKGLVDNDIRLVNLKTLNINMNNAGSIIYCSRFREFNQENNYLQAIENLKKHQIDCLIILGGNGSYMGAKLLANHGIKTICIPCTIDNDINYTQYTIGFYSAVNEIMNTLQTLRFNAKSHGNIYLVEIMGRKCSDLTIASALASEIDYIITSDNVKTKEELLSIIKLLQHNQKREIFILITENIYKYDELNIIKDYIEQQTNISTKIHILGFIQRGAKPTGMELCHCAMVGQYVNDCLLKNITNVAICLDSLKISHIDLLNHNFYKENNNQELNLFLKKIETKY